MLSGGSDKLHLLEAPLVPKDSEVSTPTLRSLLEILTKTYKQDRLVVRRVGARPTLDLVGSSVNLGQRQQTLLQR